MRVLPADPACYLIGPADLEQGSLPDHAEKYRKSIEEIVTWARAFLCNPHPDLGREGQVCPYTRPSLDRELFWLTVYPAQNPTVEEVRSVIMKYQQWFLEMEPVAGREAQYKTILLLFPDLAPEMAPGIIDLIQATLKPEFVSKGLMIGQFHFGSDEPGLWNDNFRPLRTTVPLLAIRHMVPTDFPFLKKDRGWVKSYLQQFGYNIPKRVRAAVTDTALSFGLPTPYSYAEAPNSGPQLHPRVSSSLRKAQVHYKVHRHADLSIPINCPADFAQALGYSPERVTKSLFFRCQPSGPYGMLVCPSTGKADLGRLAEHLGCRRVELASRDDLLKMVGYPSAGVSPLGVDPIPVYIHSGLLDFPTVLIGAGEVGIEIEMSPRDLQAITRAKVLDIAELEPLAMSS